MWEGIRFPKKADSLEQTVSGALSREHALSQKSMYVVVTEVVTDWLL